MKRGHQSLIAGLDIGSTQVRMAVGQLFSREGSSSPELQILGTAESPSEGVHRGTINSIEEVVSSISACLENIERMIGAPIDKVWLGVSGPHIKANASKGVVAVSKADNEISLEDMQRAIEASRAVSTPLNYEVLHVFPKSYNVDGQGNIKDPIGMTGIRLEVDTQIILGSTAQIKNLTKAVYRSGLDIEDLVLSIMAATEAVVTRKQKELGVASVNIGGSTTSLAVFEGGELLHVAVLPIGSEHITNDVAIGLRTSIEVAEKVKLKYGNCLADAISKKDEIDLFEFGTAEHEMVKTHYISEIIEARAEEILSKVDQELKSIQRSGLLPAGVVFSGGGAKLPGLVELARKYLRLPASLGYPLDIMSVSDRINDVGFTTAIGLVKWGSLVNSDLIHHPLIGGSPEGQKRVGKMPGQIKKWFKSLIP